MREDSEEDEDGGGDQGRRWQDEEEDGEYKDGLWTNLVFAGQRAPLSILAHVG